MSSLSLLAFPVNSAWAIKELLRNRSVATLSVGAFLNTQDLQGPRAEFTEHLQPGGVGSSGDGHVPNAQPSCLD